MKAEEVLRSIEREAATRRNLPIIGPAKGALLDRAVRRYRPRRILEVGTLVGYSAIRMGRLLPRGGRITCVEVDGDMVAVARSNIRKAGLSGRIDVLRGDARRVLPKLSGRFDMVFIDAKKSSYLSYLKACEELIPRHGVVVADNVKIYADEMADYLRYVRGSGKYRSRYAEARMSSGRVDAVEISVKK